MKKWKHLTWAILLCFVLTACGSGGTTPATETPATASTSADEAPGPIDDQESESSPETTPDSEGPSLDVPSSDGDILSGDESLTGEELLQSMAGRHFEQISYKHVMEYVSDDGTSTQNVTWVDAAGNTRTEMSMGEGQGAFIDIYLVDEGASYQYQENTTHGMVYRDDEETSEYDEEDDMDIDLESGFLEEGGVLIKAEVQNYKGQKALYVEMESPELDGNDFSVHTKYWMSLEYGILLEAETRMNESVVYIMRTIEFESGINPDPALFIIPDDIEFQDMSFDFMDGMSDMDLEGMELDGEGLDWLNDLLDDDDEDE